MLGIHNGGKGLIDVEYEQLDRVNTSGIIDRGGTILGSSRVSPLKVEDGTSKVFDTVKELELDEEQRKTLDRLVKSKIVRVKEGELD